MVKDIVPDIITNIQNDFDQKKEASKKIKTALNKLSLKKATYVDVNEFSIEVGELLADALGKNITIDVLPDGKMYYNIADRVLNTTLENNHELISSYAVDVQTELNHEVGLKIKGQTAELNQERIDGLVNKISTAENFDDVKWLLNEPIVNFSQSIIDDVIKNNVEFHAKSGLKPTITRVVDLYDACKWCRNLAGTYNYPDVSDDVYRRHERCRCIVDYKPNNKKRQNVWSKEWQDPERDKKIQERKKINVTERTW